MRFHVPCLQSTLLVRYGAVLTPSLSLSFPQYVTGQLDLCSAGGSPYESLYLPQPSVSSSSSSVPQLLGNQDHIKAELEKLKQTYDLQQQKLEERV